MAGSRRPVDVILLSMALGFQGLSGVGGGLGLVADPSGAALGIPLDWLEESVFTSYLIPGLTLLVVLGVLPLLVAWGVWDGRYWSRGASFCVGVTLLGWIGIEVMIVGYKPQPPLQLVYGILGMMIIGLSLRVRSLGVARGEPD